jgi:hypothetical protein
VTPTNRQRQAHGQRRRRLHSQAEHASGAVVVAETPAQRRAANKFAAAIWLNALAGALNAGAARRGTAPTVEPPGPPVTDCAVLHCPGMDTVTLPWWPDDVADAKLAAAWTQLERPGRAPLLLRAGRQLAERTISYTARHRDFDAPVARHLDRLVAMAASTTPITLMLASTDAGAWHITDLSWTVVNHSRAGEIAVAEVSMTLTRASDGGVKVGPVPPRRAGERTERLAKRTPKEKRDDKDERTGQRKPPHSSAPRDKHSPAYAKWYARQYMQTKYGWGDSQWDSLDKLWTRESGWNYKADNPNSDAYGIPQSLPGDKMSQFGADWRTNPETQIQWGLWYIHERYSTPNGAWAHSQSSGWY